MAERIPYPVLDGEFVRIYRPAGDVYRGLETQHFQPDTYYDNWIVNDFSVINDGTRWHILGITHPMPPTFIDEYNYSGNVHEPRICSFMRWPKGAPWLM